MPVSSIALLAILVAIVPLAGLIAAFTPYLMPKGECFAVTVPDGAQGDPFLRSCKRRYVTIMVALTALLTVACAFACAAGAQQWGALVVAGVTLGICAVSYGLMLYFRAKVRAYKKAQGWAATTARSMASVGSDRRRGPCR